MVVFFQSFFGQVATFTDFASQTAITDNFWLWIAAIVLSMPVRSAVESFLDKHSANGNGLATTVVFTARTALSVAILVLSVALLVGATNNAFIYTRF